MSRRKPFGRARRAERLVPALWAHAARDGVPVLLVTDYRAGDSDWIDGLVERVVTAGMPRCSHLRRWPGGGFVHAHEGFGRCPSCYGRHVAALTLSGGWDQPCCGRCGERAARRPVAIELGTWMVVSVLCSVCAAGVLAMNLRPQAAVSGEVR